MALSRRFDVIGTPPADVVETRNFVLIGTIVFTVVSSISMVLRFVARWNGAQSRALRMDDWLILAGYMIALVPVTCVCIGK
jgi:hypothetical protein